MQKGKFIVLEGIDGCGKTTIAKILAPKLKAIVTKEPTTQTAAGKKIHAILRHKRPAPDALEMQKLYIADRALHSKKIASALDRGKTVLCQRYAMSTYAYGMSFGVPQDALKHDFITPDMTVLLDLPAEEAMERIRGRNQGHEYFEKIEKLKKIRKLYLKLARLAARQAGQKIFGEVLIVDATLNPEMIVKKILDIL